MSNQEPDGLNDDGSWPDWLLTPNASRTDQDGYSQISRYVTPQLVDELGFGPGHRRDALRAGLSGPARDRRTAEVLWELLVAERIAYADPPWSPGVGQVIRDPEWLLTPRPRAAGTCVDLCLLLAGLCLNERLDTFLVMLRGENAAHVLVAIRLGTSAPDGPLKAKHRIAQPILPSGTEPTGTDGVFRIGDIELLIADEDMLFLDPTAAAADEAHQALSDSEKLALARLTCGKYEHAHLVDIAVRQWACGDIPLPRPRHRRSPAASQQSAPARIQAAAEEVPHATAPRTPADQAAIATDETLLALLRMRAARSITDPVARIEELQAVLELFETAWLRRRAIAGDDDPSVDRAYFYRAGIRVTLAREFTATAPNTASAYLREAMEVYRTASRFRKHYYDGPNPITAAALHGIGMTGYYMVLYDLAPNSEIALEEAIRAANEALAMRRQTSSTGNIDESAGILLGLSGLDLTDEQTLGLELEQPEP